MDVIRVIIGVPEGVIGLGLQPVPGKVVIRTEGPLILFVVGYLDWIVRIDKAVTGCQFEAFRNKKVTGLISMWNSQC